jgi:hypothetical protein
MLERVAVHTETDVRLVGRLRVHLHTRLSVPFQAYRLRLSRLRFLEISEQFLHAVVQAVADLAPDADDHP